MFRKRAVFALLVSVCWASDLPAQHKMAAAPQYSDAEGRRPDDGGGKTGGKQPAGTQGQGNNARNSGAGTDRGNPPKTNNPPSQPWYAPLTTIVQQMTAKPDKSQVRVPLVIGKNQGTAITLLSAANLQARFIGDQGLADQQSPRAGQMVAPGSTVTVTLDTPLTLVPPLINLTLDQAQERLQNALLSTGSITGDNTQGSTVVAQSIDAGTEEPRGSRVGLTLQAPAPAPQPDQPVPAAAPIVNQPQIIKVPSLRNSTLAEATAKLNGLQLVLGPWAGPADGLVYSQNPAAQTKVPAGSSVSVRLQLETVTVPNVVPQQLPVWVWASAAALATLGLLGTIGLIKHALHHPVKPADWKVSPRPVTPQIRLGQSGGPKIQFTVGLRSRASTAHYRCEREPIVKRKG